MSGKKRPLGGHHSDEIAIATTDVLEGRYGSVEKTSRVLVAADDSVPMGELWIGLKIGVKQKVSLLIVNDRAWVDSTKDEHAYHINLNEKQKLTRRATKDGISFDTRLKLTGPFPVNAVAPDAQIIPIAVCYVPRDPASLSRKDIILGHSVVPAPPKARKSARGTARRTKSARGRRGAQRRRRRRS
ncbi:MAG: hypothetical protein AUI36_26630 [Cyanobacteria bacterium 13_1_40CM_2_61_4]|nr:MAG: hypothetical protein AUI36_26630 [Cyanobacteria bacterium 13_1_40CM_2_61_4]